MVTRWMRYSGRAVAVIVSTAVRTPSGLAKTVSGTVVFETFFPSVHVTDVRPSPPVVFGEGEVKPSGFVAACLKVTEIPESTLPAASKAEA